MNPSTAKKSLLTVTVALLLATDAAAETSEPSTADAPAADLPTPEAWEAGPDRETLVRFARAWGLVSSILETEAPEIDPLDDEVAEPEALESDVRRQVRRHIRNNGLDQQQWSKLMARMDADPEFRTRVEMLAIPYQTPTQ